MQKHEGRSFALPPPPPSLPCPGRTGRRGWQRPDLPRPVAPLRVPLPSPDAVVPDLETAEAATLLDDFLALPPTARRDLLTARVEAGL